MLTNYVLTMTVLAYAPWSGRQQHIYLDPYAEIGNWSRHRLARAAVIGPRRRMAQRTGD